MTVQPATRVNLDVLPEGARVRCLHCSKIAPVYKWIMGPPDAYELACPHCRYVVTNQIA